MTTRYSMRMIEVDTIEFNINLTQNDIESIDVMTLDNDNKEVKLFNKSTLRNEKYTFFFCFAIILSFSYFL